MTERSRRYWTECLTCESFASSEGLDDFFPKVEASQHELEFRAIGERHETVVRWRAVEEVKS